MKKLYYRLSLSILFFFTLSVPQLQAQCLVHITSDTLCQKNVYQLPIQLLGPSFATADSLIYMLNGQQVDARLNFMWKDTGTYQIIVHSLDTAGQTTCKDTASFFVAPLPVVNYVILSADTQCYVENQILIRNQSSVWQADSGRNDHIILWGDGAAEKHPFFSEYGDTSRHAYPQLNTHQFQLFIRITDQRGCIQDTSFNSNYIKGLVYSLFHLSSDWCGPVHYGGTDFSINFDSTLIDSFEWKLDDVVFEKQNLAFAYPLDIAGKHKLSLSVWTKDGCFQTYDQETSVLNPGIQINRADTVFIEDATIEFQTPLVETATLFWLFGDVNSGPKNFSGRIPATHTFTKLGKYTISINGNLNNCSKTASKTIFVTGPLAKINPVPYAFQASCNANDTVFLSQSSLYYFNDANPADDSIPANNRPDNIKGIWDFGDLIAPTCTTDTRNGLNINTNCRYSTDSATKHLFSGNGLHIIRYIATDTLSNRGSQDSIILQFGTPKLDDFETETKCFTPYHDFYLRWNSQSGRPQSTFRILIDSAADRNDNTPNVFDHWIHEGQTKYDASTPNPFIKATGAAIHQAYLTPGFRQAFHEDGYITIGLHLFNGDTNSSSFCDTIIWIHHALQLDRFNLGANSTLTNYAQSDSISWTLTDRRVLDMKEIAFVVNPESSLASNFSASWERDDKYIRDFQVGSHVYDYILRTSGFTQLTTDSILIRHTNNGQLVYQDWRDTLIEIPPAQSFKNGRYTTTVLHFEECMGSESEVHVIGHTNALLLFYPKPDSFLFIGDTLLLRDTLLYWLEEPDPITGNHFDLYSYWRDPAHHPDGSNRPAPPGGYETVEWKANGVSFASGIDAIFVPQDTGWYFIEAISTDSTGRKQTLSAEIPVFAINTNLQLIPDTSQLGPQMEDGDEPGTDFNTDLNGLLINRDCDYFIQFEQHSQVLDPCMSRYGVPCLPEVKSGVRLGSTGPVSFFDNKKPILMPFNLLEANEYGLVFQVSPFRIIQHDTLIDFDVHIEYAITDSVLCNDEELIINNLSNGLGQDVKYLVLVRNSKTLFADDAVFKIGNLPRGSNTVFLDVYPGTIVPGGIYCPIRTTLQNISAGGTANLKITGVNMGSPGQINLYKAEIGSAGTGTYQWNIVNGNLLSASITDTISAYFNMGNGSLMVAYSEAICPAVMDTLYFVTTGLQQVDSRLVKLYPNPGKGSLHFSGIEGRAVIKVYSAQGVEVYKNEVELSDFTIDNLLPGAYFLRVEGYEGMNYRFIIEN